MKCPICEGKSTVIETTTEPDATYRIRKCKECDFKFVSKEEITCMAVNLARRRWSGKKTDKNTCTTCNNFRECNTITKQRMKMKNYPCWGEIVIKQITPKNCCDNCTFKNDCEEDIKTTAKKEKYWCWSGDVT